MLPKITTLDEYRTVDLRGPSIIEATREVFSNLKLPVADISFPSDGSSPVAIVDDKKILKFFAPLFSDAFEMEWQSLKFIDHLGLSPKLFNTGSINDWNYVLMSKLKGQSLKNLWPQLSEDERHSACYMVGKGLKKIHSLPVHASDFKPSQWTNFLTEQTLACAKRQEKLGLRANLVDQIPIFLKETELISSHPPSFLHTEVMRDHVFFDRSDQDLLFSGFIDFEPSMIGEAEYDFASVGIFLSSGDPKALRSFFSGYGNLSAIDYKFKRRILAYTLLHKYSNLKWYLEFMPQGNSLDELAEKWWAV